MQQIDFLEILQPTPPPPAPARPAPRAVSWDPPRRSPDEIAMMRERRRRSLERSAAAMVPDPGEGAGVWTCPKCRQGRGGHTGCHTIGHGRFLICTHKKPRRK